MKTKCPYCGTMFNDTKTHCPSCGAPNEAVVRTSGAQPLTIEELKQWYQDRGLPPAKTTRFFIGEDYKGARAFGIYKDPETGNFVVYKNKDNGQRAVRYEGTDEAYAVNELFQRLKEEIIQQKRNNLSDTASKPSRKSRSRKTKSLSSCGGILSGILLFFGLVFGILAKVVAIVAGGVVLIIIIGVGILLVEDAPRNGYYQYQQAYYYHYDFSEPSGMTDWFLYDVNSQEWIGPLSKAERPDELKKNKKAKKYFVSQELPSDLSDHSFTDSLAYQDVLAGETKQGYYEYENQTYYYQESSDSGEWYFYDVTNLAWYVAQIDSVPEELKHSSVAQDFYYTPTWDSTTQITDFKDSTYYKAPETEKKSSTSRWDNDNDDSDYDWGSSDSWSSDSTDWDSDW